MTELEISKLCDELFVEGLKSTINFNDEQKTLFLFLDIFNYIDEDGLDVYLSNNLYSPFEIQPSIDSMKELGLYQIAEKFEFIKERFDNNKQHHEWESWDEYKSRIGIKNEVNSWDTSLIREIRDNFPHEWIYKNLNNLIDGLVIEKANR